jgi:hypothetical protein
MSLSITYWKANASPRYNFENSGLEWRMGKWRNLRSADDQVLAVSQPGCVTAAAGRVLHSQCGVFEAQPCSLTSSFRSHAKGQHSRHPNYAKAPFLRGQCIGPPLRKARSYPQVTWTDAKPQIAFCSDRRQRGPCDCHLTHIVNSVSIDAWSSTCTLEICASPLS